MTELEARAVEAAQKASLDCTIECDADEGCEECRPLAAAFLRFAAESDKRKLERSNEPTEGSLYMIVAGDEFDARRAADRLEGKKT